MSNTKETPDSLKKLLISIDVDIEKRKSQIKFNEFENNLRKKLNSSWKQDGNGHISFDDKINYIKKLEKFLFDTLNLYGEMTER